MTRTDGREQRIEVAADGWKKGTVTVPQIGERKVASAGAWVAEDTYEARIVLYETPFVVTLRLKFAGDEVFHDSASNVGFGPGGREPQLVGKRQ